MLLCGQIHTKRERSRQCVYYDSFVCQLPLIYIFGADSAITDEIAWIFTASFLTPSSTRQVNFSQNAPFVSWSRLFSSLFYDSFLLLSNSFDLVQVATFSLFAAKPFLLSSRIFMYIHKSIGLFFTYSFVIHFEQWSITIKAGHKYAKERKRAKCVQPL